MDNGLIQLHKLGQSIWYDNISRNLISTGGLQKLADLGVLGVTSNPTIFEKAISTNTEYDKSIKILFENNITTSMIIEELMIEDIIEACDIFLPVFEKTDNEDGFVSIEVEPTLAKDTQGTIEAAKRIWNKVNRPNLMIKIPATVEGISAFEEVISAGINVNVTLIFSIERYNEVTCAYVRGLTKAIQNNIRIKNIHSVASVFISRLDSIVDILLAERIKLGNIYLNDLLGKAAVANTKLLYQSFKSIFSGKDFISLKELGANVQRPLWASTGTKSPNYSQTLYVDELVASQTVNTLPPSTLEKVQNKEYKEILIENELDYYKNVLEILTKNGIDFNNVFIQLEKEGVDSFIKSFNSLLETINKKIQHIKN